MLAAHPHYSPQNIKTSARLHSYDRCMKIVDIKMETCAVQSIETAQLANTTIIGQQELPGVTAHQVTQG